MFKRKIAIFGANSQISKDFLKTIAHKNNQIFLLFSRDLSVTQNWIKEQNLTDTCEAYEYEDFKYINWDIMVNFIGIGDPKKLEMIAEKIIHITDTYDWMILDILLKFPDKKYIFISSGAAYNSLFDEPVSEETLTSVSINKPNIYGEYATAKLIAELRHRNFNKLNIIDLRIFNYIRSDRLDEENSLIGQIYHSLKNKNRFITTEQNITRDYIDTSHFTRCLEILFDTDGHNTAYDLFSKKPLDKFALLKHLEKEFSFDYSFQKLDKNYIFKPTGIKPNYFSQSKKLKCLNYISTKSSLEIVMDEFNKQLNN